MKKINTKIPLIGLFLLLSLMSLLLTLYAAKIYDNMVNNNHKQNTAFTAATYMTEKIKQAPKQIIIKNNQLIIPHDNIQTIIYVYENNLYETMIYADKQLTPGTGELLFHISDMTLSQKNNLLTIRISDKNNTCIKRKAIYYE